jgi:hypothetical protein
MMAANAHTPSMKRVIIVATTGRYDRSSTTTITKTMVTQSHPPTKVTNKMAPLCFPALRSTSSSDTGNLRDVYGDAHATMVRAVPAGRQLTVRDLVVSRIDPE